MNQSAGNATPRPRHDEPDRPRLYYAGCSGVAAASIIALGIFQAVLVESRHAYWWPYGTVLLGSVVLGVVLALAAIVLGRNVLQWGRIIYLTRREKLGAFVDLAVGFLVLLGVAGAVILPRVLEHRHERPNYCQNNLKQLGLVCRMFARENNGGFFPELSPKSGRLAMFNDRAAANPVYPEYLLDALWLSCPVSLDREESLKNNEAGAADPQGVWFDRSSYIYLGYAVANEAELLAFAEAYRSRIAQGLRFDADLPVAPGAGMLGRDRIMRLRDDLAEQMLPPTRTPAECRRLESSIPVCIERPGNHDRPGGNVLFLDGHVEFMKYPGKFPMSKESIEMLKSLESP